MLKMLSAMFLILFLLFLFFHTFQPKNHVSTLLEAIKTDSFTVELFSIFGFVFFCFVVVVGIQKCKMLNSYKLSNYANYYNFFFKKKRTKPINCKKRDTKYLSVAEAVKICFNELSEQLFTVPTLY